MCARILLIVPLLLAGNAFGCLNDRETVAAEREFRSRYLSPAMPGGPRVDGPPQVAERREWNPAGLGLTAAGAGMMAIATVVARRRLRPAARPAERVTVEI
jgi:hypothetical protein